MKLQVFSFICIPALVFASMRPPAPSDFPHSAILPAANSGESPLVKYGEYVFTIENCNRCHTLEKFENEELVSLDGMANKYTPSWHYSHLVDPASMVIDSKMPSFGRLADREMDKSLFLKLSNSFGDHDWEKLNAESELLYGVIQPAIGKIPRRSELLALIAYLESIPMSPELEAFVSIENAKMASRQQGWDQYVGSQGSGVYQMKPDKKMIESGSEIYRKYSCGACHGMSGEGMIGPNLTDNFWLHGNSTHDIVSSIAYGWPAKGMKSWKFEMDTSEVAPLIAYIRSLYGTNPANAKAPQGDEK